MRSYSLIIESWIMEVPFYSACIPLSVLYVFFSPIECCTRITEVYDGLMYCALLCYRCPSCAEMFALYLLSL